MSLVAEKKQKRQRRHARIRARIFGTAARPRLAAHKSNRSVSAQLINDETGTTIAQVHSAALKAAAGKRLTEAAHLVGKEIAKRAKKERIECVVFDRGGFLYTGSIKEVAEGAREGGLTL